MNEALWEVVEELAEGAFGAMWPMFRPKVIRWMQENPETEGWAIEKLRLAFQEGRL